MSDENQVSSGIEKSFVDSFQELGLDQCVSEPTHIKGRTLDLLLTNSRDLVTNVKVFPDKNLCFSDHYLINFEVKTDININKNINKFLTEKFSTSRKQIG